MVAARGITFRFDVTRPLFYRPKNKNYGAIEVK